jgi:hypothetical protein
VRMTLLLAAWACLMAAVLVHMSTLADRLLRADPSALPGNNALTAGKGCMGHIARAVTGLRGREIRGAGFPS